MPTAVARPYEGMVGISDPCSTSTGSGKRKEKVQKKQIDMTATIATKKDSKERMPSRWRLRKVMASTAVTMHPNQRGNPNRIRNAMAEVITA